MQSISGNTKTGLVGIMARTSAARTLPSPRDMLAPSHRQSESAESRRLVHPHRLQHPRHRRPAGVTGGARRRRHSFRQLQFVGDPLVDRICTGCGQGAGGMRRTSSESDARCSREARLCTSRIDRLCCFHGINRIPRLHPESMRSTTTQQNKKPPVRTRASPNSSDHQEDKITNNVFRLLRPENK